MQVTGFIPSFSMSTFAQSISSPYTSFKAYQAGAIDANGNLLKPETSIDDYEYFIIKLKKIFEEIPTSYTKARLNSYSSAFQLFTEEAKKYGLNQTEFLYFMEGYAISQEFINEDMTTGAAVGGLGKPIPHENTGEVSGYDPMLGAPMFRRAGNVEMFDVSPQEFSQFKIHKAWKHLPDSETKKYLQRFQRRNKDSKMAVRSLNKDNGKYDVHWINMKPISFMEEFGLQGQDILNEDSSDAMREIINRGAETLINPPQHHRTKKGNIKRGAKTEKFGSMLVGMHNLLQNPDMADDIVLNSLSAYGHDVSHTGADIGIIDPKTGKLGPGDIKGENTTPFTYIKKTDLPSLPFGKMLSGFVDRYIKDGGFGSSEKTEVRSTVKPLATAHQKHLIDFLETGLTSKGTQWGVVPTGTAKGSWNFPGLLTVVPTENIADYAKTAAQPKIDPRFTKDLEFRVRGRDINTEKVAPIISKGAGILTTGQAMGMFEKNLPSKTFRNLLRTINPEIKRASQS